MALSRWWRWGWPLILLGLMAAIPLLVWSGWSAISESSDGTDVSTPVDPTAPGYQAFVDPTPTLLLIHGDDNGLDGVSLLALTDAGAEGAVLFVAPETMTPGGRLGALWIESGSAGVVDAVAGLLGIRPSELQVVNDQGWAAMVAAVAPISVDNPDPLVTATEERRFGAGVLSLAAGDVGPYLGWRNPDESPAAALFRHELFWEAWLEAIAVSPQAVIPGETDRGMGRFGRDLARGRVRFETAPGVVDESGAVVLDAAKAGELVAEIVPFSIPTIDTGRPRVLLLNGVGDPRFTKVAARALSRAGARIVLIGNASEFGWEITRIAHHDSGFAPDALAYRDALGTGSVTVQEQWDPGIDITVTFGADFSQRFAGDG
ncbi:LytR C-terminal domain-containing protein [Candidatus Poriferisocius sp.]|uniref:LytR C-terminal domain-containing protein n=1 Tax=Candidatus Poriferisocius sp. TaxID=3101276 RepID=UPI003B02BE96